MKTIFRTMLACSALLLALAAEAEAILIDSFADNQTVFSIGMPQVTGTVAGGMLGGDRDIELNNSSAGIVSLLVMGGNADYGSGTGNSASTFISWDGLDGDPLSNGLGGLDTAAGLGGVDLTDGGGSDSLRVQILSDDLAAQLKVRVFTDAGNASEGTIALPGGIGVPTPFTLDFTTDFSTLLGTGANFTSVNAIELEIDPMGNQLDLTFDFIDTTGDGGGPGPEVPEPSALAIWSVLLGLGYATGWRRRRRSRG